MKASAQNMEGFEQGRLGDVPSPVMKRGQSVPASVVKVAVRSGRYKRSYWRVDATPDWGVATAAEIHRSRKGKGKNGKEYRG